jgi:hypothetical protein
MREQPLNDETLHPVLAELPVFTADAELWPRILARHAKKQPARFHYRWIALASAAAVVAGAILMLPRNGTEPTALDGQRESQALENEWRALAPAPSRPTADIARLYMIDAALQSAYDRGAHADELQPLWQQRNEALRGLILTARTDTVTRI